MNLGWVGLTQVWSEEVRTSRWTSRWTSSRTSGEIQGVVQGVRWTQEESIMNLVLSRLVSIEV